MTAPAVEQIKKLDENAEGSPTIAAADPKETTAEAVGKAIAGDENNAGVALAAEALLPKIDKHVEAAEVQVVDTESDAAAQAQAALDGTGVMATGPHVTTEGLGESNVINFGDHKAQKTLEAQAIEARGVAAKGAADNGGKWGKLAQFIANLRKRSHNLPQTLPENVTPISVDPRLNQNNQEQATPLDKAA